MKKKMIMAVVLSAAVLMAGCGKEHEAAEPQEKEVQTQEIQNKEEAVAEEKADITETENVSETAEEITEEITEETTTATTAALPAYVYPGPELFYTVLYDYVIGEIGQYMDGGVVIPDIMITGMDESDREDIKVYGDFACYTYTASGDTLERNSGGSFPGCVHVKSTDDGYMVTGMERTEDGGLFDESVDRIFGDQAESFRKAYSDDAEKERVWTQILANYVAANGLEYKYVKDYGWDPIELPAENIDNFYGTGL